VETLGATPETTLMVGDSEADVKAARAAGLKGVILVSFGYSVTPVTELRADVVINHLHELVPTLALVEQAQ
jgi:phosphoglycolate phosphatase